MGVDRSASNANRRLLSAQWRGLFRSVDSPYNLMLEIVVNGKAEKLEGPVSIAQFLTSKGVSKTALVERNREIVKRDRYEDIELQNGDELEVVQMMAGG